MITVDNPVPGTVLIAPVFELDYYDTQNVVVRHDLAILKAYQDMTTDLPGIYGLLFRLRDALAALCGVKPIGGFGMKECESARVGDHLDFFKIELLDHDRLILSANDHHLDVIISINMHVDNDIKQTRLHLTASVKTHNTVGRIYMLPVRPVHSRLVAAMLNNISLLR